MMYEDDLYDFVNKAANCTAIFSMSVCLFCWSYMNYGWTFLETFFYGG